MLALAMLFGCVKKEERVGGIEGAVLCSETNEGIRATIVLINPHTDFEEIYDAPDGWFEFGLLKTGDYTLNITAHGYLTENPYTFRVEEGAPNARNIVLEKIQTLRVVNEKLEDIYELNFDDDADISRTFYVLNVGIETLEWNIPVPVPDAPWITDISLDNGSIEPGDKEGIVVTIDRALLAGGPNSTSIWVRTEDKGSRVLATSATGLKPTTLGAIEIPFRTATTAVFNSEIIYPGFPEYTERGFVYSTLSTPSYNHPNSTTIIASITPDPAFSEEVVGLLPNQTYYVRAYAIYEGMPVYSSNVNNFFNTNNITLPTVSTLAPTNINILAGTVTLVGSIGNVGDPPYTERGFVLGISTNPTIDNSLLKLSEISSVTGYFQQNVTGLSQGSYNVRAYAINSLGTVTYGLNFPLDFNIVTPTIKTERPDNVENGKAVFRGKIEDFGDFNDFDFVEFGFVWNVNSDMTLPPSGDPRRRTTTLSGNVFTLDQVLENGKPYWVSAYVIDFSGKEHFGEVVEFSLLPIVTLRNSSRRLMVYPSEYFPPSNTYDLGYSQGQVSYTRALEHCDELNINSFGGFDDWKLPDREELIDGLYVDNISPLPIIQGLISDYYWSSNSEGSGFYTVNLEHGNVIVREITYPARVRCVRPINNP